MKYGRPLRFFRHPLLHTGLDLETKLGLERILEEHGYLVAPVTMDNSEWIYARAFDIAYADADESLKQRIAAAYLDYIEAAAELTAYLEENPGRDEALLFHVLGGESALFADGPTLIKNVWNLRIKETDRLEALQTELRKLGARATAGEDSLHIQPGPLHGARIETYDDHRMAMSFALAGLKVPGIVILDPGCVSKTWPGFFDAFHGL